MSVDLSIWVADRLNGDTDELMYRAIRLRGSPLEGPHSWFRDRFALAKRLWLGAWRMRLRAKPLASDVVIFDVGLNAEYRTLRSAFLEHHFGERADFVSAATPRSAPGGGRGWWRWYMTGLGLSIRALFDLSSRRYFWLGQQLLEIQALALAAPGIRRAFVFRLFDRRPYLAATFLARHTKADVECVFQNIPLWRNCRYFHIDVPVVVTSRVNVPEVQWLRERGFFRTPQVVYRSQEYVGTIPAPSPPRFDIGFFSSGEWARRHGLYQVADAGVVRGGSLADNEYARTARWLLETLAEYARQRRLTLRIYPHPYERKLLVDHGIIPPWIDLVDGDRVTYEDEGKDSRPAIYESRVAVSLQSSFIWERIDLGLDESFIFDFEDDTLGAFKSESLGEYRANTFASAAELVERLDSVFASADQGSTV